MKLTIPTLAALALVATQAGAAPPGELLDRPAVELPVREVTVYSDRARVTRRGDVAAESFRPVREGVVVRLPSLPVSIDPSTVRLESSNARVVRVDVQRAERGEFPRGEAEELLARLEKLRDEEAALMDAIASIGAERDFLRGIHPTAAPIVDPKLGPSLLDPAGWRASLAFLEGREQRDAEQLPSLEQKLRAKRKEIAEVSARAQQIAMDPNARPGWTVDAFLDGKTKTAQLSLTYMAHGARWFPTYDVRSTPGEGTVDVDFSGLVSQTTGEDWNEAKLVLSTAIPATTATLPKLAVWKIGDKDRFIPKPVAEWQPPLNPPPRPPPPRPIPLESEASRDEFLRRALAQAASGPYPTPRPTPVRPSEPKYDRRKNEAKEMDFSADEIEGDLERPSPAYEAAPAPMAPPPPRPSMAPQVAQRRASAMVDSVGESLSVSSLERGPSGPPPQAVGFGAPRGWQPPQYEADLPAALAGGYDFSYPSARPESIASGAQARRIALHSKRFPAESMVRILPALAKQAYLVAEVKNDSDKPLLKGRANLFVGADLVGEAIVPTTPVGANVTLPLGVDEAIRIERNVQVVASERGVFSKQDVNSYEVSIELMNPRMRTVKAVVVDQYPLAREKNVEVTFDKAEPAATANAEEGLLEWKLDLPSGVKKQIRFTYTFVRPKGARPWQVVAPLGSR